MQHPGLLRDIVAWDVGTWQQAIYFWEQRLPQRLDGFKALELGAAQGGLSLYLGLKGAEVICSDLTNPEQRARSLHQRYALQNMRYQAVDARQLPFADQSLDLVCFKSVLGGIRKGAEQDPKPEIMAEIYRVLKPGAYLLLAENLQGYAFLGYLRKHFIPWSLGWEYLSTAQILDLLQDFQSVDYHRAGLLALLGRNESQRRLLGRLDRRLVSVLPSEWRYLFMGVARK